MLAVGDRVLHFETERLLDETTVSTTYLVRHTVAGTLWALQVLRHVRTGDAQRLLEHQARARLEHPNVLAVVDVVDVHGAPGVIRPFVDGVDLATHLSRRRPDLEEASALAEGILEGLGQVHDRGWVHGLLTPADIVLQRRTAGLVPRVAGIGIARVLRAGTAPGHGHGAPAYLAPEQHEDPDAADARTDVYALGTVLYELLCGEPAFPGHDMVAVLEAVRASDYVSLLARVPDLAPWRDRAIRSALAPDPAHRPRDARALQHAWLGEVTRPRPLPIAVQDTAVPTDASPPPPPRVNPNAETVPPASPRRVRTRGPSLLPLLALTIPVALLGAACGLLWLLPLATSDRPAPPPVDVAAPALPDALTHRNPVDRSEALAQLDDEEAAAVLALALDDPHPLVRRKAWDQVRERWRGGRGDVAALEAVAVHVAGGRDAEARSAAFDLLEASGTGLGPAAPLLGHEEAPVRMAALALLVALAQRHGSEAHLAAMMRERLPREPDERIAAALETALAVLEDDGPVEAPPTPEAREAAQPG